MKTLLISTGLIAILFFALSAVEAQQADPAATVKWRSDPTEFVRLVMSGNLGLRPSASGVPSVPVSETVRQQIIGASVTWTVIRRASPFPNGPRTLLIAPIEQDKQVSGLLLLMPRRAVGDDEVCEVPYQNTAINGAVEILGKIANFQAGVRPDGNIVVVVEVIEVSGCEARPAVLQPDLVGRWDFKRTSAPRIRSDNRLLDISRDVSCDQEGFACYTYQPPLVASDKEPPRKWIIAIKGSQVVICMSGCVFSCAGSLTDKGQIRGQCQFIGMPAGDFTLSQLRNEAQEPLESKDKVSEPPGSKSNPVRGDGPRGERQYLKRLRCPDGKRPQYDRVGSFPGGPYGNILDEYRVKCEMV